MRCESWAGRPARRWTVVVLLLVGIAAVGSGVTPARADGAARGGDVTVAQTLGDRELTVVLRRVTSTPGPLHIDVVSHAGVVPGPLALSLVPAGVSDDPEATPSGVPTAAGRVLLGPVPGSASTVLPVERPGPWELTLDDGRHRAAIPFVVPAQATAPAEKLVYLGFVAAGLLLGVTVLVAVRARRGGWVLLPGAAMVAALAMAVTAGQLSSVTPYPPEPGVQIDPTVRNVTDPYALATQPIADWSRSPATLLVAPGPAPTAGPAPTDLTLGLVDASTGAPVDDLVVHDGALMHLMVVGPTGRMTHLHPPRVAPGRYDMRAVLPVPGHYAIAAELVRRGGGVQMLRSATGVDVVPGPGAARPGDTGPVRLGPGTGQGAIRLDGLAVSVRTAATPVAGRPTTLNARVGDTPTLQPWLGMAGHMIVTGPVPPGADGRLGAAAQSAPIWAHAHSMGGGPGMDGSGMPGMPGMDGTSGMDGMPGMGAMTPPPPVNGDSAPDESVAAYGPDVAFTFTFAAPGTYRVWIQVERDYAIHTVPVVLDVGAPEPSRVSP